MLNYNYKVNLFNKYWKIKFKFLKLYINVKFKH